MDINQLLLAWMIGMFGGLLQGSVAFGFGLVTIPLLLSAGYAPPVILAITAICTATQSFTATHHLRHVVPWKPVGISLAIRIIGICAGISVLRVFVAAPVAAIKFWVGAVLICLLATQAVWQPKPRRRLHHAWDLAAFLASGFTGGLCGMGGPPLVLWVMAHDWPPDRSRAFLFASFMGIAPFQLALLYMAFPDTIPHGIVLGLMIAPSVLLGSILGLRIGARFSKPVLRRTAYFILTIIALNSMLPQLLAWQR